jgi:hypothetical protein
VLRYKRVELRRGCAFELAVSCELHRSRSAHFGDLASARPLEELERGHRSDLEPLSQLGLLVHVDFLPLSAWGQLYRSFEDVPQT